MVQILPGHHAESGCATILPTIHASLSGDACRMPLGELGHALVGCFRKDVEFSATATAVETAKLSSGTGGFATDTGLGDFIDGGAELVVGFQSN